MSIMMVQPDEYSLCGETEVELTRRLKCDGLSTHPTPHIK
jgi:hypothetical protein